jgi:hypothetical protein
VLKEKHVKSFLYITFFPSIVIVNLVFPKVAQRNVLNMHYRKRYTNNRASYVAHLSCDFSSLCDLSRHKYRWKTTSGNVVTDSVLLPKPRSSIVTSGEIFGSRIYCNATAIDTTFHHLTVVRT